VELDPVAIVAVRLASDEAAMQGRTAITPYALLLGIAREGTSDAAKILARFGLNLRELRRLWKPPPPQQDTAISGRLPLDPATRTAIDVALRQAHLFKHPNLSATHILIGILHDAAGEPCEAISQLNTNPAHVRLVAIESSKSRARNDTRCDPGVTLSYCSVSTGERTRHSWLRRILTRLQKGQ
jgi:ATP-dependent Clp protease ATP-binding subunit ClpA